VNDLIALSAPWWVFVLRAALVFVGVMVLIRMSGKRAVGQFTPFDLVMLILIGNAVQNGMNGGDNSLTAALILSVTLVSLNWLTAFITSRSKTAEREIEGKAVVLARDGRLLPDVLRKELVSKADFREAMRENNIEEVDRIRVALLETNGKISFETLDS
jgi:uncharacterized membrane protein YcaP (DUF421 family)